MEGFVIFVTAIILSLVWLWAGGLEFEKDDIVKFDEEDKKNIQ